ncbi:MAG: amidohydrolase, partial [Burkholderiales bacterium]|nr:amidohydrolase [Burkholderiales bacterium]
MATGVAGLRAAGVSHLAVMALANTRLDASEAWALVPEGFDYLGAPSYNETDDLLQFNVENDGVIFPMLD